MTPREKADPPEDICAETQPLQEKRAFTMADVKEFKSSPDDRSSSFEVESSLSRMPLIVEPLAGYLSKYFDELSSDDLKKSPYKDRSRTLPMYRLSPDC